VRRHLAVALILSGLGGLGLLWALSSHKSVREDIADRYSFVGREDVPDDKDKTLVYASKQNVSRTAKDIADRHKPADRHSSPQGVYLRYKKDIVAVVPRPEGTRILVDDEDTGYRHHYFFVGGWWGTYSGRSEGFRGGGPGGGK
jgi:hypothetical protein